MMSICSQEHGVSNSLLLQESQKSLSPKDCKSILFVIPPKVRLLESALALISEDSKYQQTVAKNYHIIFVPVLSYACKTLLQERNMTNSFDSITEFPLTLLPLDHDLLSMERPDCFANYALSHHQQLIYQFTQGLMRLQSIYGLFPRVKARGEKAKEVAKMLLRMRHEVSTTSPDAQQSTPSSQQLPLDQLESQVDLLIIIDRSVDPLTPLLSQLTYEGLIDELWGIKYGSSNLPLSTVSGSSQLKRQTLNASDELFDQLRDQHFHTVGPILARKSKELAVRQNVLQLVCLQCFCSGGLKPRLLDYYKREIIQSYGLDHACPVLDNLERIGLLHDSTQLTFGSPGDQSSMVRSSIIGVSKNFAPLLRRGLQLLYTGPPPSSSSDQADTDQLVASLYSGYLPLSIRVIQQLLQPSSTSSGDTTQPTADSQSITTTPLSDLISMGRRVISGTGSPDLRRQLLTGLPGQLVLDEYQLNVDSITPNADDDVSMAASDRRQVVALAFVGGVTRAEVAALRLLANQLETVWDIESILVQIKFTPVQTVSRLYKE